MLLGSPNAEASARRPFGRRTAAGLRLATLAIAVGLLAAACGSSTSTTTTTSAGAAASTAGGATPPPGSGSKVTVYTGRHYGIEPVFAEFTAATGIPVEFVSGKDPELRARLAAEGADTPADLFMAADAGNLYLAAEEGLLVAPGGDARTRLDAAVPANLRDPDGRWYSLSRRARTIAYATERVDPSSLRTYADLTKPEWKGRICLRPATHPYTQSLVASVIAAEGEAKASELVSGWVANEPTYIDSDTEILEALAAGTCDVALVNSYYLGRKKIEDRDFPVGLVWAEQEGRGTHVNVSGAGVTAGAPNPEGAATLLAWLAGPGQKAFADANAEFPVDPTVPPTTEVAAWGPFLADPVWVGEFGRLQAAAVAVLDRAGYL